jgi:hypothetical protein
MWTLNGRLELTKVILTEKRTNMTPQNMEMYILIYCYEN